MEKYWKGPTILTISRLDIVVVLTSAQNDDTEDTDDEYHTDKKARQKDHMTVVHTEAVKNLEHGFRYIQVRNIFCRKRRHFRRGRRRD